MRSFSLSLSIFVCFFLDHVQFFITTKAGLKNLDGKHVVFGEVIDGLDVVDAMQNVKVSPSNSCPLSENEVEFIHCGELQSSVVQRKRVVVVRIQQTRMDQQLFCTTRRGMLQSLNRMRPTELFSANATTSTFETRGHHPSSSKPNASTEYWLLEGMSGHVIAMARVNRPSLMVHEDTIRASRTSTIFLPFKHMESTWRDKLLNMHIVILFVILAGCRGLWWHFHGQQ